MLNLFKSFCVIVCLIVICHITKGITTFDLTNSWSNCQLYNPSMSGVIMANGVPYTGTISYQTNFTQNVWITNTFGHVIFISELVTNSPALVTGQVGTQLFLSYTTNQASYSIVGSTIQPTVISALPSTIPEQLQISVPCGCIFMYTNVSYGGLNISGPYFGSGQLIIFP